jgi:sugar phosphate isomerase/epimerase
LIELRPALCSVTFRKLAPDAVVRLAAEAGLAAIEWGGDVHVPPGDLAQARSVRHLTEDAGLRPASYGSYIRPPQDGWDAFQRVLETAVILGSSNIRVWAGPMGRASQDYTPDERTAVANLLRSMAEHAQASGVTLSLEYHRGTLTDDLASAQALLAEVEHPTLFTYWQPRPGLPLQTALEEIAGLSSDMSHVHVFAWDQEARRYPLADHAGYWRCAFDALRASRWQGTRYAMLEFVADDAPERFRSDAAELLSLLSPQGAMG